LYANGFIVFKYFKHSVSGFYYQRKFLIIPAGECFLTISEEDFIDKIISSFSTGQMQINAVTSITAPGNKTPKLLQKIKLLLPVAGLR